MRKVIFFKITFLLCLNILLSNDFVQVQTPYQYVHKLKFLKDNLMVISGDSAYIDLTKFNPFIQYVGGGFYISTNLGEKFLGPYLDGTTVLDIEQSKLNDDRFFALGAKFGRTGIYESTDKGKTWSFMPKFEESSIMHKLITLSQDKSETIFIANLNSSDGLIISQNNFENTLKPQFIQSQIYDIKYSEKLKQFFLASDHNEHGHVIRFDGKSVYKDVTGLKGLRVLSVQPSSFNPAFVYAGVDSLTFAKVAVGKGIYMSIDTGKTWKYLTGDGMQVFDIQEHPSEINYIAAAMGVGGVGISSNFGQYFEIYRNGLPKDAEVRSVAIPNIQIDVVGIIVYPVTLEHGVYKSRPLTSSISENRNQSDFRIEMISPNPAQSFVQVQYFTEKAEPIQIVIIDYLGRVVFSDNLGFSHIGHNSFTINDLNLSTGHYYLILKSNSKLVHNPLIIAQ